MTKTLLITLIAPLLLAFQPTEAQPVTIEADDGLTLHADYYPPSSSGSPAVLLLHQLYTNRTSWDDFIPALQAEGYAVLAPDLRGYGQTRGNIGWREAQHDTLLWLDWLRAQEGVDSGRVAIVGSSMGANLAVIGCADDRVRGGGCTTAVAISPGLNYFGYTPLSPALGALDGREVLFISSERDGYPARAVRELSAEFPTVTPLWVAGNAHGVDLFDSDETVIPAVVAWLNIHT
ncbi:MAG: alpha/beta fold hydrolase [Chloroflexota bacterium]